MLYHPITSTVIRMDIPLSLGDIGVALWLYEPLVPWTKPKKTSKRIPLYQEYVHNFSDIRCRFHSLIFLSGDVSLHD